MANKERLEDRVEHAQEEPGEKPNYPGAVQETDLESSNKQLVQFGKELEHLDKRASDVFDQRRDVLGYPMAEHEKLCESYAAAFAKIELQGTLFEKREISREISLDLFDGMYRQASNEFNFRPYDPSLPHPHSVEVLDSYHDTFAHALEGGANGKPDTNLMYEAIREAHDYTLTHGLQEPKILNEEQFEEFTETSRQHQWTEMLKMVDHTWHDAHGALEKMRRENEAGYEDARSYLNTATEVIHKYGLYDSLAAQNYEDFKETNNMAHQGAQELVDAVQNNAGFVGLEDYKQCELPDKFETVSEADQYLRRTGEQLELMRGNEAAMSTFAHRAATQISSNLDGCIENAESEIRTAQDDHDPEYSKDHMEEASTHLELAYKTAQRLNFLMKPRENND